MELSSITKFFAHTHMRSYTQYIQVFVCVYIAKIIERRVVYTATTTTTSAHRERENKYITITER